MDVTHQIVTYCLNPDGTIPDFVYHGNDGIGGVYGIPDPTHSSPQDLVMLCLTEYPVPNPKPDTIHLLINDKQELTDYLTVVLDGQTEPNPDDPDGPPIPVDIAANIEWVWSSYERVNNL